MREKRRVRLDPRRRGYLLDGELHRGFSDPENLDLADRLFVARWASRFAAESVSEAQRELLAREGREPKPSTAQRELHDNQVELRAPYMVALYDSLDDGERKAVRDPAAGLGARDRGYPLSVGDLARLTGASERQLRSWADDGLLPSYRDGDRRRFYSAALIRAFAIARAPTHEKAVLAAAAKGEAGHLFQLIAATIGRAAADLPEEPADKLSSLAEELTSSSVVMADVDRRKKTIDMWHRKISAREHRRPAKNVPHVLVVKATPQDKGWAIVVEGRKRAKSLHSTKAEADAAGRKFAKTKKAIYYQLRRDGTVALTHSYAQQVPHGVADPVMKCLDEPIGLHRKP